MLLVACAATLGPVLLYTLVNNKKRKYIEERIEERIRFGNVLELFESDMLILDPDFADYSHTPALTLKEIESRLICLAERLTRAECETVRCCKLDPPPPSHILLEVARNEERCRTELLDLDAVIKVCSIKGICSRSEALQRFPKSR